MYRFLVVAHIVDIGVKKCRLYKTSITLFVYYILTKKGGSKKVMHYYQLYKKFETKNGFPTSAIIQPSQKWKFRARHF